MAKTDLHEHRMSAEKIHEVIKTMTGKAALVLSGDNGTYFRLHPVSNMENVEITFYSMHVDDGESYGKDLMTVADYEEIAGILHRSRRWKFSKTGARARPGVVPIVPA
jgi:hypothetical protein